MSVINNVLKGLDERPSQFSAMKRSQPEGRDHETRQRRSGWLLFSVMAGVIVVLAGAFVYQENTHVLNRQVEADKNQLSAARNMPPASKPVMDAAIVLPIKEAEQKDIPNKNMPVKVTGLQINETAEYMGLSLQLESEAQAFLKQSSRNRYRFLITNTEKKIIAPDIEQSAWLERITVSKQPEGYELNFDTADEVLVESRGQVKDGHYQWLIRLKKQAEAVVPTQRVEPETVPAAVSPVRSAALSDISAVAARKKLEDKKQQTVVKVDINPVKQPLTEASRYQRALQVLQRGDWAHAEQQLKALLDSSQDKKARKSLLSLYESKGMDLVQQRLLQKSLQRYHSDPDFRLLDASRLFSAARYQSLIKRYQADKQHKAMINLVAAAQQVMGDHAAAIRSFRDSLKIDARQPRNWVSLAISLEQQKQFSQALSAYQSAQKSGALNIRLKQFVRQRIEQLSNAG